MKSNVVRVEAAGRTGFGFLVGLRSREALIATAWHTLRESGNAPLSICFLYSPERCVKGKLVYVADAIGARPGLDLAIASVEYPAGLPWRADIHAVVPAANEPVWFIGRSGEWYIPPASGRALNFDAATQLLTYSGLDVTEGVSGAPIVTATGIAAMHVASVGKSGEARGVGIDAIRDRVVNDLHARWILMPQVQCDKQTAQRNALAGRAIVFHFDAQRPDVGLGALARLGCLGAHVVPHPVWPGETWPGELVAYGDGELRAARALQSALGSMVRLDTRFDRGRTDLQVWAR